MSQLVNAKTIGVIDPNGVLSLNWQPILVDGAYTAYLNWNIWTISPPISGTPQLQSVNGSLPTGLEFGGTVDSRSFQVALAAAEYAVNMQALANTGYTNASTWDAPHAFPTQIYTSDVTLNKANANRDEPVIITLGAYNGASTWRIVFQDGSTTGWMPISLKNVVKQFSKAGQQTLTVEVQNDYSSSNPPVQLRRQVLETIFIRDQEYAPAVTTGTVTGNLLGIGGQAGFEIIDAADPTSIPENFAVVTRNLVKDSVTNELKLLVATSRFESASSLLGTMAIDVFPIVGRPHIKELLSITPALSTFSTNPSVPLKMTFPSSSALLPAFTVGITAPEIKLTATGGNLPYSWYAENLPYGMKLSIDGTLSGVPLTLGKFPVNISVKDSTQPEFIDNISTSMQIVTDLTITNTSPLPTAVVGSPFQYQMVNTGGILPFTWSLAAGSLAPGISINPNTGVLTGTPVTYNSTTDFTKTFQATIQVTDAVGAKASALFSQSLSAAALSMGSIGQQNVFAGEEFKTNCPVFGGKSPYTLNSVSDAGVISGATLIDGRVEFTINATAAQIGTQTALFTITDANSTVASFQRSYNILPQISTVEISNATFNRWWKTSDSGPITAVALTSNIATITAVNVLSNSDVVTITGLTNTVLNGTWTVTRANNSVSTITNVALTTNVATITASNSFATNDIVVISGLTNTVLNGTWTVTSASGSSFTFAFTHANIGSVADSGTATGTSFNFAFTHSNISTTADVGLFAVTMTLPITGSLTGLTLNTFSPITLSNGLTATIDTTNSLAKLTGPFTLGTTADFSFPLQLYRGGNLITQVSRRYYTAAHSGTTELGTQTTNRNTLFVGELVGINPLKNGPNAASFSKDVLYTVRVQSGSSLPGGLSLDANTGLIYGTITSAGITQTVLEYLKSGIIKGTVIVNWNIVSSSFKFTDNLGAAQNQAAYSGNLTANTPLSSASLYQGSLPLGLTFSVSGNQILVTGNPTECGYFDIWFAATDINGNKGYFYKRLVVNYITPLMILTDTLPTIQTSQSYSKTLQPFGGVAPYTWALNGSTSATITNVALTSNVATITANNSFIVGTSVVISGLTTTALNGTWTVATASGTQFTFAFTYANISSTPDNGTATSNNLPNGFSFNTSTGVLSGTTTASVYNQNLSFQVTDSRSVIATQTLNLQVNNTLTITTTVLPIGTNGQQYLFQMNAIGGTGLGYTWIQTNSGTNPLSAAGLTLSSSGALSGVAIGPYGPLAIAFQVTDSGANTAAATLNLTVGASTGLVINTSGITPVLRVIQYLGTLGVTGGVSPYTWSVAPTWALPNGLVIATTSSDSGASATVSGITSNRFIAQASNPTPNGITNVALTSNVATITTAANHNFVTGNQVVISGLTTTALNGTWLLISGSGTTFTFAFTHANIGSTADTGIATGIGTEVQAVDTNGNSAFAILSFTSTSGLTITTATLPPGTITATYSTTLAATGINTPFTWSLSSGSLPAGLSLSSGGVISGTPTTAGSSTFTVKVTDNIGDTATQSLTILIQATNLNITNTSPLPNVTAGVPYSFNLNGTGGTPPYSWLLDSSSATLPAGLNLNQSTGIISGTTSVTGTFSIVPKLQDVTTAFVTKSLSLTAAAGLTLTSGIDYTDGTATGYIGFVASGDVNSISVRPNKSFYVVASGVISTQPSQLQVVLSNSNMTALVESIVGGIAMIRLSGPFSSGTVGDNTLNITVVDNGVSVSSAALKWKVYTSNALRLAPGTGSFPSYIV
jgi:hypothetical protein